MSIQIGSGGGYLRLTAADQHPRPESLRVEVDIDGLSASWLVIESPLSGFEHLARFFEQMAGDWRGWDGSRSWTSLEGDLHITASHSGRRVRLVVILRTLDRPWRVEAEIPLDPGEDLTRAGRDVRSLVTPDR